MAIEKLIPFPTSTNRGIAQLETHDARLRQDPVVSSIPSLAFNKRRRVLRIPVQEYLTGEDVMRLAEGVHMPVELVLGVDKVE